jgi:hypothetical protein
MAMHRRIPDVVDEERLVATTPVLPIDRVIEPSCDALDSAKLNGVLPVSYIDAPRNGAYAK